MRSRPFDTAFFAVLHGVATATSLAAQTLKTYRLEATPSTNAYDYYC